MALYLKEILSLAEEHIESPQWALKHTAARSIADATVAVATMNSEMETAIAATLWPSLEKALNGKTWDGKEVVLHAFSKFVETSKAFWSKQQDVAGAIEKVSDRVLVSMGSIGHTHCHCK